jgi:hypothetical protein
MFKRRYLLIAVLGVLLVAAAVFVWLARPGKALVIIEVTGTQGLAVQGTSEVDGSSEDLEGAVPARFVLEGSRVTFSLSSTEDSGEFRVRAAIGDRAFGSLSSGRPPRRGIRGWVKTGWCWSLPDYWLEGYDRGKDEEWTKPPP